jgi:tol-pal system protein YbgF
LTETRVSLDRPFRALALAAMLLLAALLAPLPAAAQSQQTAQLTVRIQELEEQIRLLTGQVEGLQFQLTQMQTLLERMGQDNEFRFQQLEGNAGVAAPAPSGDLGAAPADQLPSEPQDTAGLPAGDALDLGAPMETLSTGDLGESSDPLLGTGGGEAPLGTLGGEDLTLGGSRPLDLSLSGAGGDISNGDANAQYQAGYDAIVRGDYAFAEDQFQQFVQLYPDDPNAPDATNWLGEAMMQRGAFDDAALVLAEGYQKYSASARAPDLMLKLGIALVGAGEQEVACRTFFTLERRYTGLSPAFMQRLSDEKARAQCPV